MPSFLSLPPKLVHEVISIASQDDEEAYTKLLAQCALICKTIYRITRQLLFNGLDLTVEAEDARTIPAILTYQHKDLSLPPLFRHVRKVNLTFDIVQHALNEAYVEYLDALLSPFSGDACRIREFNFAADRNKDEKRIVYPDALPWYNLPPSTQQKFANILRSPSLEVLDIYGIVNIPFRLLRSATSTGSLTSLTLSFTSVAVEPEDLHTSPTHVPPLLAIEELAIGELEFKLVPPSSTTTRTETGKNAIKTATSSLALHEGLSHLIDLGRLQTLAVVQAPRGTHIKGSPPSMKEIFSLCSSIQGVKIEFLRCEDLHTLHLDKLPSSTTWFELYGHGALPFISGVDGAPDTQAKFTGTDNAALFPTNIASSSHPTPELTEVTINQPLSIQQRGDQQIETLVLADGSTSYWEALVQSIMTIPASTIYLQIDVEFQIPEDFDTRIPEDVRGRPDKKINTEMNRVFEEYNANHPNRPIVVEYSCSLTGN